MKERVLLNKKGSILAFSLVILTLMVAITLTISSTVLVEKKEARN